jgi:hypothetical protein
MGDVLLPPTQELEMVVEEEGQGKEGECDLNQESVTSGLGGHTLQQMLGLLVRIACSAAGLGNTQGHVSSTTGNDGTATNSGTQSGTGAGGVAPDVVVYVVREALSTLGTLLQSHPELYDALLESPW